MAVESAGRLRGVPIPREHGAWGLLLQPFVAGAVLAGSWTWLLGAALVLVLLGFLLREPLVILARQAFVWRTRNPQSDIALRWLVVEALGVFACLAILVPRVPAEPLLGLLAGGGVLTLVAMWFTGKNRQRSVALQVLSAAGLGTTALLAVLVSSGEIPGWAWVLWAFLTLHAVAGILTVHARLDLKAALRKGPAGNPRRFAYLAQGVQALAGAAMLAYEPVLAVPLLFSALANSLELIRMSSPGNLLEPLPRVGLRTLAVSLAHMVLTIVVMWPAAGA